MDWIAGEILKQIDKSGLVDNTLVIFTSDNGPYISEQSCSGKKGPFQGAWYDHKTAKQICSQLRDNISC
jgi:arylsulfatase